MKKPIIGLLTILFFIGLIGCGRKESADSEPTDQFSKQQATRWSSIPNSILTIGDGTVSVQPEANGLRNAYFGDLHVHTTYSFDAFVFGTLATPYDAYRFAKGEPIQHPGGFDVQLREPLDFFAVTDHAMFLGAMPAVADTTTDISKLEIYRSLHNINATKRGALYRFLPASAQGIVDGLDILKRLKAFATFIPNTVAGIQDSTVDTELILDVTRSAWADTIKAAQQYNDPGRFTTFIAYEYTSGANDMGSLHRNVIFKGENRVPEVPFSRFHSQNPEGLWDWMDELREQGIESLAIPHNSNRSNGHMFTKSNWAGNPIDKQYMEQRIRNEPLVEIAQIKGASETHPALSQNDEWADFEIMPYRAGPPGVENEPRGSYVRNALLLGLGMEEKTGSNPYEFGFIGSSDTHTGATSDDESTYHGKLGLLDKNSMLRGSTPMPKAQAWIYRKRGAGRLMANLEGRDYLKGSSERFGSAGLAGVWAEENTRDAIYDALRRKETFATSGPRIRVRFFAGFDFDDSILDSADMIAKAYAGGVPMGQNLAPYSGEVPKFLVWATRDPGSAPLQRIQIIKGWIEAGTPKEEVFDVACSDGLQVDPTTFRCPDNDAQVNLTDCSITEDAGDTELKTLWTDPDFDPDQKAFYYVRVLENPTCRWSTWDAIRAGVDPRPDLKKTIQERAWSSPIWYVP